MRCHASDPSESRSSVSKAVRQASARPLAPRLAKRVANRASARRGWVIRVPLSGRSGSGGDHPTRRTVRGPSTRTSRWRQTSGPSATRRTPAVPDPPQTHRPKRLLTDIRFSGVLNRFDLKQDTSDRISTGARDDAVRNRRGPGVARHTFFDVCHPPQPRRVSGTATTP